MDQEIKAFLDGMASLRGSIRQSLTGVDPQGLNWNPLPGDANSLYAIVSHLCAGEANTIHRRIGGRPVGGGTPYEAFAAQGDDPQKLLGRMDEVGSTTRSLLEGFTARDLDRVIDSGDPRSSRTAREMMNGVLRHTALHLGHIEITKQFYATGIVAAR